MYAFTLSCYKAGIRGIDLHLRVRPHPALQPSAASCLPTALPLRALAARGLCAPLNASL
jgi:hypothetical protein